MIDFRFANPEWIHGLWGVLFIVALLMMLEWRGRTILERFLSEKMQWRLAHRVSSTRRWGTIVLFGVAMVLLVGALMRPQWGATKQATVRVESQIMVCLDLSKSMLAEDVAPNRLERAKVELDSLFGLMEEGQQAGLIGFAGKATVMCPLTTDLGFLRMVLAEAYPRSIGLGGTKIGEALSKAVRGFGEAGDMNRLILLITDGEDHDSFPMEVAERAREKGIKIVCIGFGDEAGSKIEVTHPRTGVRSFIKDRDGQDVVSYLNGEMLRDIALKTEGAYVPAGTGALDLDSIYEGHIRSFLEGKLTDEERLVRNEIYQWPLFGAILMLLAAWFCSVPFRLRERAAWAAGRGVEQVGPKVALLLGLICGGLLSDAEAWASVVQTSGVQKRQPLFLQTHYSQTRCRYPQTTAEEPDENSQQDVIESSSDELEKKNRSSDEDVIPDEIDPREAYNQALPYIQTDPDRAEKWLNHARRDAGADGEIRFRALYNLGWVSVHRADGLLEKEPKQALVHLEQAVNRFREAIRVRPESQDARYNLEVVSRRVLELTDALNKQDPKKLEARLDELIQQIRDHSATIQNQAQSAGALDRNVSEETRQPYRQLGVTQRQLISDVEQFANEARQQVDAIQVKPEQEQTEQERVQAIQLANMLYYIESSIQRMKKARSLTRRLQATRAFQRWAAALSEAKRARDQLRHPVQVIGVLLQEARDVQRQTKMYLQGKAEILPTAPPKQVPAWLTQGYLTESQTAIQARTKELYDVLQQMIEAASQTPTVDETGHQQPQNAETQQLLENIEVALPILQQAVQRFEAAVTQWEQAEVAAAAEEQQAGITHLADAWELFYDIRRLIEAIYRDEILVQHGMTTAKHRSEMSQQIVEAVEPLQAKNLTRAQRLQTLIEQQQAQLAEIPSNDAPSGEQQGAAERMEAEREQLKRAIELLVGATHSMEQVESGLKQLAAQVDSAATSEDRQNDETDNEPNVNDDSEGNGNSADEATIDKEKQLEQTLAHVDESIEQIEELRRLFFSLVEHLRDTAQRQANLNDETLQQQNQPAEQWPEKLGPLNDRQQQLEMLSQEIAKGLQQQSQQVGDAANQLAAANPNQAPNPSQPASGQSDESQAASQQAETFAQAAELVEQARQAMSDASEQMKIIQDGQQDIEENPNHVAEATGVEETNEGDVNDEVASGDATDSQTNETPSTAEEPSLPHPSAWEQVDDQPWKQVGDQQSEALENLLKALQLLEDPNKQNQQNQNQQQQNQQQQQQQQQQQEQQQRQQQEMNAQQLLQLVRDREAKRRKDKQKSKSGVGMVEKDW